MKILKITPHLFDVFADPTTEKTGWEPSLWVRVFVKHPKVEYVKGNKRILQDAIKKLLAV